MVSLCSFNFQLLDFAGTVSSGHTTISQERSLCRLHQLQNFIQGEWAAGGGTQ